MEWLDKVMHPMRRVWNGVALRIGIRKRGLLKLRYDVHACEYEDVRIMWEMLRQNETKNGRRSVTNLNQKRCFWNCFSWARSTPYFGRNYC
ncbi:uncharacterized protein LOC126665461 [Mercurialis annua]|uniref:uncharacterized protein LOC126665461 n=1 Tax=Mercurialis annua TaxID=3986 RepID=UPI00215FA6F0|nr:uncharacterized protein LOC126665461 [Mercurialis annua]